MLLSLQADFIALALVADPSLNKSRLAELLGVSRQAIGAGSFDLGRALAAWKQSGRPEIRLIPARLELAVAPVEPSPAPLARASRRRAGGAGGEQG